MVWKFVPWPPLRSTTSSPRLRHRFCLTYGRVLAFSSALITTLAVLDRFLWNVWPRQHVVRQIGAGGPGFDSVDYAETEDFGVLFYQVFARIYDVVFSDKSPV